MTRDPYPLQWPEGWPRSKVPAHLRPRPKFSSSFAQNRDSVLKQLRRRGVRVVITSDLPVRNDGLPYANAMCSDPGIAVWWVEDSRERVIACDRWGRVQENLRAIDMSLEALRGLDRWGASEMVERAFAGFGALPPGQAAEPRPWRQVLGGDWPAELEPDLALVLARQRYKRASREAHPDLGGSAERMIELNRAMEAAARELAPEVA